MPLPSTRQAANSLSDENKLLIRCAWAGNQAFASAAGIVSGWPPGSCVVLRHLQEQEGRHAAELKALRHEFYEQLQDIRQCSGCMSPSPPPRKTG